MALGWRVVDEGAGVITVAASEPFWPVINVAAVSEGKSIKSWLRFDLHADGVSTAEELGPDRVLTLGAGHVGVGQRSDASWVVHAYPAGDRFCLLSRPVRAL
ncbi:VOC family protein [Micromonospora sp. NPDC051006]|uniref:VOC family protein n=1 Tax=Micromonospora sp. NPDC051006 TaxID=3364283 RepID=UPI00378B4E43